MWLYLLILIGLIALLLVIVFIGHILYTTLKVKIWFKKRGLESGSSFPLLGESWRLIWGKDSWGRMIRRTYEERGVGKRYYGVYNMTQTIIAIKDPELIKEITVKDFDHFTDHLQFIVGDVDPLWSKNLFSLTGDKWHDMRTTLSPAYTSNKLKLMFNMIHDEAKNLVNFFEWGHPEEVIEVELKDAFTRFTNDVIATTAFGIKVESFRQRHNTFYWMGRKATSFGTPMSLLKLMVQGYMPRISKSFGWGMYTNDVRDFFRETIKDTIDTRKRDNIVRHDMINLLMEASVDGALSDDDITAQVLIFLLGGFESVANVICFTAYELAVNPDIQDRLRQEILDTIIDGYGELTYEGVTQMKYLDMVISETLRKWPNNMHTDRVCTKPYTIEAASPDEKSITLEKGNCVWVPIYGLHMDPKYFPDPEKFDPDRFSDENKSNIIPYTYLPFGAGQRKCIGSRFALLEAKLFLCELLSKFQIVPTEKSQIPLKLKLGLLSLSSEGGFNFGFKKI